MGLSKIIFFIISVFLIPFVCIGQIKAVGKEKPDTIVKPLANIPKPYKEIITPNSFTLTGLFKVHKVDMRYYFEINDSLFDKDILIVNRITKGAAEIRDGIFGYGGDLIGSNVVQFSKGPNNKVFIKRVSFLERSVDSSENGMYRSVQNSTFQAIVASFDIKAFSPGGTGVVLDMTDCINGDNDIFFFDDALKKSINLSTEQQDKCYIENIKPFPLNVEIHTVKTYMKADLLVTYELNSSIVLLPGKLMTPRYEDKRIGYFSTGYVNYDANPQGYQSTSVITRWRLEPREQDLDHFRHGDLVEPQKPIVYYIDPATPQKWIPYLIQGVNDWQKAFEKAGFKNAIYALEAPANDSNWSMEDARHNVLVYKSSPISNASGPHIHDPRTGEILETHVNWYHNVMQLIHDWYMVQAGASDSNARTMQFSDSLMGQLIRFISSHEIGHTLGLLHNFGASSTVPVDSLRNKKWVEANGICPSIMDYARFNYVAQPGDSITEKELFPRIGDYDLWAIEWGYRYFPDSKTQLEEKQFLNKWVVEKLKNPRLRFGSELQTSDPRCQAEDLGDDAMKASSYGIANLKRILPQLINWTRQPNEDGFSSLKRIYDVLFSQYKRYLLHVAKNVGGLMHTYKTAEQPGSTFEFTDRNRQKKAVQFIQEQLFITPKWLLDTAIFLQGAGGSMYQLLTLQQEVLQKLMSYETFTNLLWFESVLPNEAYPIKELLTDLQEGIWIELRKKTHIDFFRRNLQKAYVGQLIILLHPDENGLFGKGNLNTDALSIVKETTRGLLNKINVYLLTSKDGDSIAHLKDLKERINDALKAKK